MNNDNALFIEKVQIINLWQQGDILWELLPDVNVLVGNNGKGKTTLLNLLYEALKPNEMDIDFRKFDIIDSLTIQFSHNRYVQIDVDGRKLFGLENLSALNIQKISTFDVVSNEIFSAEDKTKTLLDRQIDALKEPFTRYQRNLLKTIETLFYSDNLPSKEERDRIFGKKNLFIKQLNKLFLETKKEFKEDDFAFQQESQMLLPQALSSGEKQVFILLLSTLLQNNQPCILLMDEPEISLHIEWQRELISLIRELNENCQLIIVTHSPSLYFKGWSDRMRRIENIVQAKNNSVIVPITENNTELTNFMAQLKNPRLQRYDMNNLLNKQSSFSLDDCQRILSLVKERKLNPDVYTLTILISKLDSVDDCQRLLAENSSIKPNIITYNTLLKKVTEITQGLDIIQQMVEKGYQPDIIAFSTLLGKVRLGREEVDKIENLRKYYGVHTNDIYLTKLRAKL